MEPEDVSTGSVTILLPASLGFPEDSFLLGVQCGLLGLQCGYQEETLVQ